MSGGDMTARLRLEGEAKGFVAAVQQADKALDRLKASEAGVAAGSTKAAAGLGQVGTAGAKAGAGLNTAAAGGDRFTASARMAHTAGALLGTTLAYLGGRELVRGMNEAAFATQGWSTGLGAVAGGAVGARTEMAFLSAESTRLGLIVRDQTNGFMSLAGATNGTSLAGDQTREIWLGLVEAGTALNRSNEQQKRGLEAVSQIASKGVVSMEELRGQLSEAIPGAMQIAARSMDMTSGELIKLVSEGKLASDVFLPRFAAQLREEFGPAVEASMNTPLGRARVELAKTENALFSLQAAGGEGFLSGVIGGVTGLNEALNDPQAREAARELGEDLGELVGLAAGGLGTLVENIDLVVDGVQVLTALGLAKWFADATSELMKNRAAMAGGTAATLNLRTAMGGLVGFMGGPVGLTLAAVGTGVWAVTDAMREAERTEASLTQATERYNSAMGQAEDFLRAAAEASRDFGDANAGAVRGTDALANATFRLANARAEAARQAINDAIAANEAEIKRIERPGILTTLGEVLLYGGGSGDTYDPGTSPTPAESNEARRRAAADKLRADNARLMAQSMRLVVDPASGIPDRPTASSSSAPSGKKDKASDAEKEAQRRIETARRMAEFATAETAALDARSAAAGMGEQALEDLRVAEARLQALQQLGVTSLDQLTGKVREEAEAAIAATEAKERKTIATEKAERVAATLRSLDADIAAEQAYAAALKSGERALIDFAVAEQVRQEVERTGKTLSPDQVKAIRERVEATIQLKAANDDLADSRALEDEVRLTRMTADERERELRVIQLRDRYMRESLELTRDEADARARVTAAMEQATRRQAQDISRLKTNIRAAFIESGELGFDEVADYAERRLREAVYDALLARPIDMVINATVNMIGGGLSGALGGSGGLMGGLGSLLGVAGPFGSGWASGGGLLSAAGGLASSIGGLFGLGGGGAIAGGIGGLGAAVGGAASTAAGGAAAAGALGGMSLLGPIGAALAIGSLLMGSKKPSNNGANAVFGADGGYVIGGSERNRQTEQAATSAASAISGLMSTFKGLGIDADGIVSKIQVGTRDPSKITLGDGSTIKTRKGDMDALVDAAGKAMLSRAEFDDPQMKALVDQMIAANRSFDDIAEKLDRFVQAQAFGEDVQLALLRYTDERAYTLAALERDQKARRDQLGGFVDDGLYTEVQLAEIRANLDALEDAELAEALERLGDAATTAERALADARDGFRQWIDRQTQSALAPLNPFEQRGLAMAQYERVLEKARGGDSDALGNLTSYADRLLSADSVATSSAMERLALWTKVMGDIEALAAPAQVTSTQSAIEALTALNSQVTLQASEAVVAAISDPGGVVAVLQDQTNILSTKLDGVAGAIARAIEGLHLTTGEGLASLSAGIDNTFSAVADMTAEQRAANALAKVVAARP